MKSFYSLKDFFKDHKKSYFIGVFWLIAIDFVQILFPQIIRHLTDDFQDAVMTQNRIYMYVFLIILTGGFISIGRYFWRIYILGTSRELEYYLRRKTFGHLLDLSPNYFNKHRTGDLMAHLTNDINAVRMAIGQGTIMLVDSMFMTILSILMMILTTSFKLTLTALLTLPFIIVFVSKFGRVINKRFKIVQESFGDLTDTTQESFSGIRVIKSFVQEDLIEDHFESINNENLEKNLNLVKVSGTFYPFIRFISSLSFLLIIFFGAKEVILSNISLGDFIAFNFYLSLLVWPMMALGYVINVIQRGGASMDRINQILEEKADIKEINQPLTVGNLKGQVEFKNVSFTYPGSKVQALSNISFKLEDGGSLAIIGRTGSGKTSIISLLLRMYDIDEGEILLDGHNIQDLSLKDLRRNISYVPQDNFLFSTSIYENIYFPLEKPILKNKVYQAAKDAEIYENIMGFPEAFDTVLGERGVTLSGGQKQRTSIARALIMEAPILVLDDSLSSVDTETEEKILNNLKNNYKDKSKIIISHRISTVKDADEILVVDEGSIVERGNHEDLISFNGIYRDLYEKQLLEEKLK